MASIDTLPADQRAVLQLVLQRGRSYDDIAKLLSIDRAAVRQRALAAFDELGPQTRVLPERRALITDYLLGQLPTIPAQDVRDRLANSAGERAWGRVIASELAPIAAGRLQEIPEGAATPPPGSEAEAPPQPAAQQPPAQAPAEPRTAPETIDEDEGWTQPAAEGSAPSGQDAGATATPPPPPPPTPPPTKDRGSREPGPPAPPRSSRRGGAILLGLGAVVVAIVVIVIIATGGSDKRKTTSQAATSTTPASTSTTPTPVAQIKLSSPKGGTTTAGLAQIVKQGTKTAILIVAQGVQPNTKRDAYAVWLFNSTSDKKLLGFVNPGVTSNGKLQTADPQLPADTAHYHQLLITLETQSNPKAPGTIVLQGPLSLGQ
jgi:hypothetical protein